MILAQNMLAERLLPIRIGHPPFSGYPSTSPTGANTFESERQVLTFLGFNDKDPENFLSKSIHSPFVCVSYNMEQSLKFIQAL